jgi:ribosomal-protein-alanine N-acetyltransferase
MEFLMATQHVTQLSIGWMIRRHIPDVIDIENASFASPWSYHELMQCLRKPYCNGMVAERDGTVAGFMVYELLKSQLHILNFAVSPAFRRQQIGSQMLDKLYGKLSQQRRKEIIVEVRETNLAAQKFFSANGYLASGCIRNHYEDSTEDAIQFYRMADQD